MPHFLMRLLKMLIPEADIMAIVQKAINQSILTEKFFGKEPICNLWKRKSNVNDL
jgi:hypothetical protein